jgi:hypothetical protein
MDGAGRTADAWSGMHDAPAPLNEGRGDSLLLTHCTALTRWSDPRPPAYFRLEEAVGGELARLLLVALAGRHLRAAA